MARIRLETLIEAPIERVFDLARDLDFHRKSMAHTGEEAIGGRVTGLIDLGESVTWRARHLGFSWTLTSKVTVMQWPSSFGDVQERGPFKRFSHHHHFESVGQATRMIDEWEHEAPWGPLGWLADRLFLEQHMRRLLETRNTALKTEAERNLTSR